MFTKVLNLFKCKRGVSMPELMAGISIMAVLAGTGVTSAANQINKSKVIATMDEMKAISLALEQYHEDYPGDSISTITTLITKGYLAEGFTDAPDTDFETDWKEDAWNNDYQLEKPYIDNDGDFMRGSLTSAGTDGELVNDPDTDWNEESDNIKITLEPIVPGN